MLETIPQSGFSILREAPIRASVLKQGNAPESLGLKKETPTVRPTRIHKEWVQPFRSKPSVLDNRIKFPEQDFTLSRSGNIFQIKNDAINHWPNIELELTAAGEDEPLQVARFSVRPNGNSTEAEILYTRWVFGIVSSGEYLLPIGPTVVNFEISQFSAHEERDFLRRAQLFRKLKFIEKVFNCTFHLPNDISEFDVRQIDTVFRGITEGEFTLRGDNITFFDYSLTTHDEISRPPFTGIGSLTRDIEDPALIFGRLLPVGPMSIRLDHAVVTNSRVAESLQIGKTLPQIRFAVLDNQLHYRFEKYATRRPQIRRQKLERFKKELLKVEPSELVNLLDRPLQSDVLADEARKIVNGWLQYNDFPDRYCPQEPEIEEGRWRVPIWLTYPRGQGAWVQDAFVDLKTGVVTLPVSAEELRNLGKSVAAECLRAS